jgi:hypothetical protein
VRHDLAGIGDQQGQQPVFDRRQMHGFAALVNEPQRQVDLDVAELE